MQSVQFDEGGPRRASVRAPRTMPFFYRLAIRSGIAQNESQAKTFLLLAALAMIAAAIGVAFLAGPSGQKVVPADPHNTSIIESR